MFANPGLGLSSRDRSEEGGGDKKNDGSWADLTIDHVQLQVLLL